jgi:hypothetical protein
MKIRHWLIAISTIIGTCVTIGAAPVQASTPCQETGENCVVGERGPKGGVIFYDAGSQQWWGRYLEAKIGAEPIRLPWQYLRYSIYEINGQEKVLERQKVLQRRSMAIGMGKDNTEAMRKAESPLVRSMFPETEDWFLPSKDELDALYNFRVQYPDQIKNWAAAPVWSSSESEPGYAWYQLFQDGTQFTDAQGILPSKKMNVDYLKSPMHTGSNFVRLPMNIIRVRAFPSPASLPPTFSFVNTVRENSDCSTNALNCLIGDSGPAGGIVVYDAGSDQQWGRYLEIAPQSCEIVEVAFNSTGGKPTLYSNNAERSKAKAIGMGAKNTAMLAEKFAGAAKKASDSTCNNYSDWFLPSKDELNEAFRQLSHSRTGLQLTPVGGFARGYYWTSSDYDGNTAWSQYFADGQQFDRVQTLSKNKQKPFRPLLARPMRAFKSGDIAGGAIVAGPAAVPVVEKSISVSCNRSTVQSSDEIICMGTTKGLEEGTSLFMMRRTNGFLLEDVVAEPPKVINGSFKWIFKFSKKTEIYFEIQSALVKSNIVEIKARTLRYSP